MELTQPVVFNFTNDQMKRTGQGSGRADASFHESPPPVTGLSKERLTQVTQHFNKRIKAMGLDASVQPGQQIDPVSKHRVQQKLKALRDAAPQESLGDALKRKFDSIEKLRSERKQLDAEASERCKRLSQVSRVSADLQTITVNLLKESFQSTSGPDNPIEASQGYSAPPLSEPVSKFESGDKPPTQAEPHQQGLIPPAPPLPPRSQSPSASYIDICDDIYEAMLSGMDSWVKYPLNTLVLGEGFVDKALAAFSSHSDEVIKFIEAKLNRIKTDEQRVRAKKVIDDALRATFSDDDKRAPYNLLKHYEAIQSIPKAKDYLVSFILDVILTYPKAKLEYQEFLIKHLPPSRLNNLGTSDDLKNRSIECQFADALWQKNEKLFLELFGATAYTQQLGAFYLGQFKQRSQV